jgi:hypothetical protein
MSTGQIIGLTLQGAVFLVWAGLMFSVISTMRDRAQARTGRLYNGPRTFVTEIKVWLRNPDDKSMRNAFSFVTLCMFLMSAQSALMA